MKAITKVLTQMIDKREDEMCDFVRETLLSDEALQTELRAAGVREENMVDFIVTQYGRGRGEEELPPLRPE